MINEKGFATILGLCLILAIALVVKGIQESEGNHSYETTDFQTELDLQSAAEFGIYKAAAYVKENPLPLNDVYEQSSVYRKAVQEQGKVEPIETPSDEISVDVWVERLIIKPYKVNYASDPDVANSIKSNDVKIVYSFFSKAELKNSRTGGNLYRCAFAYVVDKIATEKTVTITLPNGKTYKDKINEIKEVDINEKNVIHFMNASTSGYNYND